MKESDTIVEDKIDAEPMSHAIVIQVSDLYKWIEVIVEVEKASHSKAMWHGEKILGPKWLYRGQYDATWQIASAFERTIAPDILEEARNREFAMWEIERSSILYFKQWAEVPKQYTPSTQGEWLALMQHYGVPTRLVDFTEVPLLALSFALECKDKQSDQDSGEPNFSIWAVPSSSPRSNFVNHRRNHSVGNRAEQIEKIVNDTQAFRAESDEYDRNTIERVLSESHLDDIDEANLLRYIPVGMNERQKRQRGVFMASTHLSCKFMPLLHKWTGTSAEDLRDNTFKIDINEVLVSSRQSRAMFDEIVGATRLIKYEFDTELRNEAKALLECCNVTKQNRYGGMERLAEETMNMMKEYA